LVFSTGANAGGLLFGLLQLGHVDGDPARFIVREAPE
jgi:hypothetical protein